MRRSGHVGGQYLSNNFQKLLHKISHISAFKCFIEKLMAFLKSIFKELLNELQHDYATALNSRRIRLFFKTENRNRNPDNRGICNRNRHFKNRNRKSNSGDYLYDKI